MKKDIYIIKNSVNNKVYIGQAKNSAERWLSHVYNAKYENKNENRTTQVIHRAMNKYGIDKFHYEVLEYQIESYDEREAYWIREYNSMVPNGYNVAPGGAGTPYGINCPFGIFRTEEELMKCVTEISSTTKTFQNIARKFHCSPEVIHAINGGERYHIDGMSYPLRNTDTTYPLELVKKIRYSLKYEPELSVNKIAKKYHVDASTIHLINRGKKYYINTEDYPLRKKRFRDLDESVADKIIEDILNSDLSFADIAKKYKTSRSVITTINAGNSHSRDSLQYPLRSNKDSRNKSRNNFLDVDEIDEICNKLADNISVREIAKEYDVSDATIRNINSGACKKYILPWHSYPIRKFK